MKSRIGHWFFKIFQFNFSVTLLVSSFYTGEVSSFTMSSNGVGTPGDSPILISGGADPSGGEGESSLKEDLTREVQSSFSRLPFLFHRIQLIMRSKNIGDQKIINDIKFIEPCFKNESNTCKDSIKNTILLIEKKFTNHPVYKDENCPSTNSTHSSVDMSIDEDLNLCISNKLTRYPPQELKRQVFSLLSHEVIHGLGFDESYASRFQSWIMDNPGISFPSLKLKPLIVKSVNDISLQLRMLSRLFSEISTQDKVAALGVCNQTISLSQAINTFVSFFNQTHYKNIMLLPTEPIGALLNDISGKMKLMILQNCIENKNTSIPNLKRSLPTLIELSDLLDNFRTNISSMAFTENFTDLIPLVPNSKSLLTILLAHQVKPKALQEINSIQCIFKGNYEHKITINPKKKQNHGYTVDLKNIIPEHFESKAPYSQLELFTSKLEKSNEVGLLLHLSQPSPSNPSLKKFTQQPRIQSTNAKKVRKNIDDKNTVIDLLQVISSDTPLEAKILLKNLNDPSASEEALIEISCSAENLGRRM